MLEVTASTNILLNIRKKYKEQEKARDKELGMAFRRTGHHTANVMKRVAARQFDSLPPVMAKGIFWKHKYKGGHSIRIGMSKKAAFLYFPHLYKDGYTRRRKDGEHVYIFPKDPRLTRKLRERADRHFQGNREVGVGEMLTIPYGNDRYYIINLAKHAGRTRRSKVKGTSKKTGLIGWAHPFHKYPLRFKFSFITRVIGGRKLNAELIKRGFL